MATPDQIAALRLLIAEPDETTYTDADLGAALDAAEGNDDAVASDIWTQKAASYATMVNVSESGSSRSLGDLHKNALAMAKQFSVTAAEVTNPTQVGTRVGRLVRR